MCNAYDHPKGRVFRLGGDHANRAGCLPETEGVQSLNGRSLGAPRFDRIRARIG
jgi:hypothetical protein